MNAENGPDKLKKNDWVIGTYCLKHSFFVQHERLNGPRSANFTDESHIGEPIREQNCLLLSGLHWLITARTDDTDRSLFRFQHEAPNNETLF